VSSVRPPGERPAAEHRSAPLDDELLAGADCVVILTAHPGVDYRAVVDTAPLVFDATGVTRAWRADHVILL
jgi:UDP-N-acetyl-D-mannosaminuronate dehydrogenase